MGVAWTAEGLGALPGRRHTGVANLLYVGVVARYMSSAVGDAIRWQRRPREVSLLADTLSTGAQLKVYGNECCHQPQIVSKINIDLNHILMFELFDVDCNFKNSIG